jgi:hypothetical protein
LRIGQIEGRGHVNAKTGAGTGLILSPDLAIYTITGRYIYGGTGKYI